MADKINELSRRTLGSYVKKATDSFHDRAIDAANAERDYEDEGVPRDVDRTLSRLYKTRRKGIRRAVDRLTKKEEEDMQDANMMVEMAVNEDVTALAEAFDLAVRQALGLSEGPEDPEDEGEAEEGSEPAEDEGSEEVEEAMLGGAKYAGKDNPNRSHDKQYYNARSREHLNKADEIERTDAKRFRRSASSYEAVRRKADVHRRAADVASDMTSKK